MAGAGPAVPPWAAWVNNLREVTPISLHAAAVIAAAVIANRFGASVGAVSVLGEN